MATLSVIKVSYRCTDNLKFHTDNLKPKYIMENIYILKTFNKKKKRIALRNGFSIIQSFGSVAYKKTEAINYIEHYQQMLVIPTKQ